MKATVLIPTEIEIKYIDVSLAVRYDDEDIPYDFPLREGNMWNATIEIDSGKIKDYPHNHPYKIFMKVVDQGIYILCDENRKEVARIENNYVPHGVVPGEYGDYVDLNINEHGIITNWPKNPDVSEFFDTND